MYSVEFVGIIVARIRGLVSLHYLLRFCKVDSKTMDIFEWWQKIKRAFLGVTALMVSSLLTLIAKFFALIKQPKISQVVFKVWAKSISAIIGMKLEVSGAMPNDGRDYIIAAQHKSLLDSIAYPAILPINVCYVAKIEIRKIPVFGKTFEQIGNYYIDRSKGVGALKGLIKYVKTEAKGRHLFIHPEGSRQEGGDVAEFKSGLGGIAMMSKRPILPMSIDGIENIWPNGERFPKPGKVKITYGKVFETANWNKESMKEDLAIIRNWMKEQAKA